MRVVVPDRCNRDLPTETRLDPQDHFPIDVEFHPPLAIPTMRNQRPLRCAIAPLRRPKKTRHRKLLCSTMPDLRGDLRPSKACPLFACTFTSSLNFRLCRRPANNTNGLALRIDQLDRSLAASYSRCDFFGDCQFRHEFAPCNTDSNLVVAAGPLITWTNAAGKERRIRLGGSARLGAS